MRIGSEELVSRNTLTAHRALILISGSIIAVSRYDLNSEEWLVAGRSVSAEAFSEIALALLTFAAIAYLVNLVGDWISFNNWSRASSAGSSMIGALGESVSVFEKLEAYSISCEQSIDKARKVAGDIEGMISDIRSAVLIDNASTGRQNTFPTGKLNELGNSVAHLQGSIETAASIPAKLDRIGEGYSRLKVAGKTTLWLWFVAVPTAIFALGLIYLTIDRQQAPFLFVT